MDKVDLTFCFLQEISFRVQLGDQLIMLRPMLLSNFVTHLRTPLACFHIAYVYDVYIQLSLFIIV
ncbi:hypothetical protein Fmac_021497 [Flemingia macrophylla]|uniref:Uncharacterized protein n=1 Tax=Flemingia macrophylla TaxID=520843 RepID=A0ABD1LYV0_9FABA